MKTNLKTILLLATICFGCSASPQDEDSPSPSPSPTDEKPHCLVGDPSARATATQVAPEPYLLRVPESEKRMLKVDPERTAAVAIAPKPDTAVVAAQADYLKRVRALSNGFAGTKDELDAALGKLKRDLLDPQ